MAEVSGGLLRGRPSLGWMDGVMVALGNRGMTVEAGHQCVKDRKEWRALVHMQQKEFHAGIFVYPNVLSGLGVYPNHLERGGMPLLMRLG